MIKVIRASSFIDDFSVPDSFMHCKTMLILALFIVLNESKQVNKIIKISIYVTSMNPFTSLTFLLLLGNSLIERLNNVGTHLNLIVSFSFPPTHQQCIF